MIGKGIDVDLEVVLTHRIVNEGGQDQEVVIGARNLQRGSAVVAEIVTLNETEAENGIAVGKEIVVVSEIGTEKVIKEMIKEMDLVNHRERSHRRRKGRDQNQRKRVAKLILLNITRALLTRKKSKTAWKLKCKNVVNA